MEFGLVATWLVTFLFLGLVTLPVSAWLFEGLDYAALSIPVALVVLAVVGHLVGHLSFGWPAAISGVVVLVVASAVAARRVSVDWRFFGEAGVVFTAAFLLIVAVRAVDPAAGPLPVAIGEKFLDYGLLRTLDRASTLPPADMWFAGERIQYHYGGHMLTSLLATITGTSSQFAYNLGLAGFYATLVTAAYGLAGSIAVQYEAPRRLAAAFGAYFVGFAGNLETAARVVVWLLPNAVAKWVVVRVGLDPSVADWTPADFWYFDASRVIPVDPNGSDPFLAATEFPLFAWINGDLHAHMMSQPFVLLAAALLFVFWRFSDDMRRRAVVLFGAIPPVVGLIGFMNIWSFPTVGGLIFLTVVFAPDNPIDTLTRRASWPDWIGPRETHVVDGLRRVTLGSLLTGLVMFLGILWTLPYWLGVVLGGPSQSVEFWIPSMPLGSLLLVHGAFLAVFVPVLAIRVGPELDAPTVDAVVIGAVFLAAVALGQPALGLFGPILIGGLWLLESRTDAGYETVLMVAGLGLILLIDYLNIAGERFNVIFKYHVAIWLFWSIAAAVLLARMVEGWPAGRGGAKVESRRTASRALVLALVITTGMYGAIGLPAHFQGGGVLSAPEQPTLDATAFLVREFPREAPAIRWLNGRPGQPTIVTAAPGGYYWRPDRGQGASAPASLTGLPTVLGWFHERQYRGAVAYQNRIEDVETIYEGSPEQQRRLLAKYDVEYVYVGPAERARYGQITVDELAVAHVAKEWDSVIIYRVNKSAL